MGKTHALAVPYPAQSHVKSLMKLSHHLVEHGFAITFVNTDFNHSRLVDALTESGEELCGIRLVSIPDGMAPGEDRNNMGMLCDALERTMASHLEALIGEINAHGGDEITCIIADVNCLSALKVPRKLGIRIAAFCPVSVGFFALILDTPKLILDASEQPSTPEMEAINTAHSIRLNDDLAQEQSIFRLTDRIRENIKDVDWILCNSFYELEAPTFNLFPNMLPIGPLLSSNQPGQPCGEFWAEDSSCLGWLSKQPVGSVIYVAFGSLAVFDQNQLHELAFGLELSDRPFLWVARPGLANGSRATYPNGFEDRVAARGKMVTWSPQEKILAHPSIACFLTHCGWNSTLEGLSMGVPLLCCPYAGDQLYNRDYVVDVLKVGLGLEGDTEGIIRKEEVKNKIDELLSDEGIRARVLELKEQARTSVADGGSSSKNFNKFVEAMKR